MKRRKIIILSYAAGLKEILLDMLSEFDLKAERINYDKPLLPQIRNADVLVNGLGRVDKSIISSIL